MSDLHNLSINELKQLKIEIETELVERYEADKLQMKMEVIDVI
jgi:hypothetical protein